MADVGKHGTPARDCGSSSSTRMIPSMGASARTTPTFHNPEAENAAGRNSHRKLTRFIPYRSLKWSEKRPDISRNLGYTYRQARARRS